VMAAALGLIAGAVGCGSDADSSNTIALPTVTAPKLAPSQSTTTVTPSAIKEQQEAAKRAIQQAETTGKPAACPQGLSKSACRALAESKGGGGSSGAPLQCTPQMSPEACDLLKQISQAQPGGSGEKVPGCNGVSREECLALIQQIAGG
jgi:hypothetical protein